MPISEHMGLSLCKCLQHSSRLCTAFRGFVVRSRVRFQAVRDSQLRTPLTKKVTASMLFEAEFLCPRTVRRGSEVEEVARVRFCCLLSFGNGPNTVSESTVSNKELSEFFGPHRVPGRELSEFLCLVFVCPSELTEFFAEFTEFAPKLSEAQ